MSAYGTHRPEHSTNQGWQDGTQGGYQPRSVNASRLWAGGAATAVVAAGVAVVAFMVVRGLFEIPVLGVDLSGGVVLASMFAYAVWAAVGALALTGIMHLLLLTALPRPRVFFGWIGAVAIALAVIAPLTVAAPADERIATAAVNLVLGAVIVGLVSISAAGAQQPLLRG